MSQSINAQATAHQTQVDAFAAQGLGLCADCLIENFRHEPEDPHIIHLQSCEGVENKMALTIIDGRGVCVDHAIVRLQAES